MHLHNGGAAADLKDKIASAKEMDAVTEDEKYRTWIKEYLH